MVLLLVGFNKLKIMDSVLKLDIKNMVADYENGRITDHELIDYLKEITAEKFGEAR